MPRHSRSAVLKSRISSMNFDFESNGNKHLKVIPSIAARRGSYLLLRGEQLEGLALQSNVPALMTAHNSNVVFVFIYLFFLLLSTIISNTYSYCIILQNTAQNICKYQCLDILNTQHSICSLEELGSTHWPLQMIFSQIRGNFSLGTFLYKHAYQCL